MPISNVGDVNKALLDPSSLTANRTFVFPDASGTISLTADLSSYVPTSRTITIAGTSNQITSSAGAQDLSTNRTWTLSIPNSAQLNIAKITNLTSNGFVKTSGGDGTLGVDTSTYIPRTATVSLTGQTTDIGSTNLTTTGSGLYRLAYYLVDSTADLTAGTIRLNVTYTDVAAAQTQQSSTVALTILGTFTQGEFIIQLASGNIAYSTTHTGIFGTATYDLYLTLEKIN